MRKRLGLTFVTILVLSLVILAGAHLVSATTNEPVSGAIWTTDEQGSVNINLYTAKEDVWLNGGPNHEGAAGLPEGDYYVKITEPDGTPLGHSPGTVHVNDLGEGRGEFVSPVRLWDILIKESDNTQGYDTTSNPGCVYKAWVSKDPTFPNDGSKTDNFKVKSQLPVPASVSGLKFNDINMNGLLDAATEPGLDGWEINLYLLKDGQRILIEQQNTDSLGTFSFINLDPGTYYVTETQQTGWYQTTPVGGEFEVTLTDAVPNVNDLRFGNTQSARLHVDKFYDANANGIWDTGEIALPGWKTNISPNIGDELTPYVDCILAGDYAVSEYMPIETNWVATKPNSVNVSLSPGDDQAVTFGNVCLGAGGGLTLGFWSNKNGQALITSSDLLTLAGLNLRNADGPNFDPATKSQLKSWLLSANATNMAYMLSAQLATMKLNVLHGFVSSNSLVWTGSAFTTVDALMNAANASLGSYGKTLSGDPNRSDQESLKNALDNANNNKNFVQSAPGPYTFN